MSPLTHFGLIETWISAEELEALREAAHGKVCLEMGAWHGASAVTMASTAELVVSVDWHGGDEQTGHADTLDTYLSNVRPLANVVPIIGRFDMVLPLLKAQFQLVFIDGCHEYAAVRQDALEADRLAPRGVVVFHDWGVFDVKAAVSDLGWQASGRVESLAFFRPEGRSR